MHEIGPIATAIQCWQDSTSVGYGTDVKDLWRRAAS
jgi:hypothetical protein